MGVVIAAVHHSPCTSQPIDVHFEPDCALCLLRARPFFGRPLESPGPGKALGTSISTTDAKGLDIAIAGAVRFIRHPTQLTHSGATAS